MSAVPDLPAGLQCCLRCGRLLTDRALHDAIEEPALASLRVARAGLAGANEVCEVCLGAYRNLLSERRTRSELVRVEEAETRLPFRLGKWLERRFGAWRVSKAEAPRPGRRQFRGKIQKTSERK